MGKPAKPRFATECVEAALLFIDISGFTASMEMFAQQGSHGIEKFWKMFNAYFCDLLDVIEVHERSQDCASDELVEDIAVSIGIVRSRSVDIHTVILIAILTIFSVLGMIR